MFVLSIQNCFIFVISYVGEIILIMMSRTWIDHGNKRNLNLINRSINGSQRAAFGPQNITSSLYLFILHTSQRLASGSISAVNHSRPSDAKFVRFVFTRITERKTWKHVSLKVQQSCNICVLAVVPDRKSFRQHRRETRLCRRWFQRN